MILGSNSDNSHEKEESKIKLLNSDFKIQKRRETVFEKDEYKSWITKPIDKAFGSDYCYCNWCLNHFLKQNIKGENGHLKSSMHAEEEVKHASKKSKQEKNNDHENDNDDSININKFELDLLEFVVKLNLPLDYV